MRQHHTLGWPSAVLAALYAPAALAVDRVELVQGSQQSGRLSADVAHASDARDRRHAARIPVNEIDSGAIRRRTHELTQARAAVKSGPLRRAAAMLAKISPRKAHARR